MIRIEIANALRALALLASGREEYRALVAEYATAVAACTPSQGGHKSWDYGYDKWDSTGAYMLAYALPLKSLIITGRKPTIVPPLSPAEVADTIASGRWNWWNGQETYFLVGNACGEAMKQLWALKP